MASNKPVIVNELFGELAVPSDEELRWTVLHTRPRCEKRLADYLGRLQITYYLPQFKIKRKYQRRQVNVTKPMFSSYLFAVLSAMDRERVAISGYVVRFIRVINQEHLLSELKSILFVSEKKEEILPAMWLGKGLEVEIIAGALAGTRGIVESHDRLSEVRLQVNMLRQAVRVDVNPKDLKIIGKYEIVEED